MAQTPAAGWCPRRREFGATRAEARGAAPSPAGSERGVEDCPSPPRERRGLPGPNG